MKLIQDSIQKISDSKHPFFIWDELRNNYFEGFCDSITIQKPITESFLQDSSIVISEIPNTFVHYDWVAYLLFGLLFGIALIWYFVPERLAGIFSFPSAIETKRVKESAANSPGFLISFFLFINYLVTFSLFIFLLLQYMVPESIDDYPNNFLILYIAAIIVVFYLFRLVFIHTNGFLFKTYFISKQQLSIYVNVDNLMGIILIPILLLLMYTNNKPFIYAGIIVVLLIHLFRWLQTFILGKSVQGFSVFHLFMYLCTLEIIPLLVLMKLLKGSLI
jgi:hypothetical protein